MSQEKPTHGLALRRQLLSRLASDVRLQLRDLQVRVRGTSVELKGQVPNLYQRELAEQVTARTPGVVGVENHLTVEPPIYTDEDMAEEVRSALAANFLVDEHRISVYVSRGVVFLRGILTSEAEKAEAEMTARLATGAQRVINQIDIVRTVVRPDGDIEGEVKADLLSELLLGSSEIEVEVHHAVVYLRGSVWDDETRRVVEFIAGRVPGVTRVVNLLSVKDHRRTA